METEPAADREPTTKPYLAVVETTVFQWVACNVLVQAHLAEEDKETMKK
jgi:hypothetical protein